jgi:hypothetical protein
MGALKYTLASLSAESPYEVLPEALVLDQEFTLYVMEGYYPCDQFIIKVGGYQYDPEECHEDRRINQYGTDVEAGELSPEDGEAAMSSDEDDETDDEEVESLSYEDDEAALSSEEEDHDSDDEQEAEALSSEKNEAALPSEDDDDNGSERDEYSSDEEAEPLSSDDDSDSDDEDHEYSTDEEEVGEEEESHGEVDVQTAMASSASEDVMVQQRNFIPCGHVVGGPAPQFASAGSTAGFMRIAALESQEGDNGNKKISVLYRGTHFLAAPDGGVRARNSGAVCHHLHFVVLPAGDTARSLQWVGASLAPHVYPERFHKRLQRLWSSLIAEVSVPTTATHVEVLADFGILRTADRTPERMESMCATLEGMVGKDFHPTLHLELDLPEPPHCGAAEDCSVCLDLLEGDDLAVWPGCSKPHVFHGACLELVLQKDDKCPLCRNLWYIDPKLPNIHTEEEEIDGARESSAGGNAKNVIQAVARTFARICMFVCNCAYRS